MEQATPATLLIVEDDPGTARLQRLRLERAGYVVAGAASAAEGLARVRRGDIDLVVLDQNLPGGASGLDLYRQMKEAGHNVPAILVTAFNDESILLRALRAGVNDFVPKTPDYFDYLLPAIERVLKEARAERQLVLLRQSEQALRNQQMWLEAVLNLMPVPLLLIEPGTARVVFANRAADELAGGSFPRGRPAEEYHLVYYYTDAAGNRLPDEQTPGVRAARGERLDGFETDWHTPGGARSLMVYADTLPAMHGGPATCVVAFQDVSRLKRVEAELREADRRKDEFLATLAHELRNPLAPIRNALSIMRLAGRDPAALDEARAIMERQVRQMVRLIDDLLDISRITRGKVALRKERVALDEVVRSAVESSRPLIDSSRHTLTVTLPPRPVVLDADPTRLAQVLLNLLNNAAKYTEPGGQIRLTSDVTGEGSGAPRLTIRVRDTGIGIPPEMLPHVFDMFIQLGRSLDRAQGGLGIGLSLVRGLVALHGGTVEAHSEGPGRGSEFVVTLPLPPQEAAEGRAPAVAPAAAGAGGRRRVLVVDDNADSAESLAMLLDMMGYEARAAHDGPEALRAAAALRPDVVLLDIGMPGMSGYEVARELRRTAGADGMRLVAMTGWGQEEDRRRSREAGFDDHLVKPVDAAALGQLLASGLEKN